MPAFSGGMILYSRRSAKSVAWSRLNVMGVSAFFFLPVLVAALTRADEFHSVTNTRWPSAVSHFASSASCVVFPDPSMPSTTNSFPGYSCGLVRLFNIRGRPAHFDAKRLVDEALERDRVTVGSPPLELGVGLGPELQQGVFAPIVQLDAADGLRMAAVQALGEPQDRGERADHAPAGAGKATQRPVFFLRRRATMVPCNERDRLDFVGLEAAQVAVADQVLETIALVARYHRRAT